YPRCSRLRRGRSRTSSRGSQGPSTFAQHGVDPMRSQHLLMTKVTKPKITSLAPQFLVDDLDRSMSFYTKLGFEFSEPWCGFYAIGRIDGLELHLKAFPKNESERQFRRENDHLDAVVGVDGIESFYEVCASSGAKILKPLSPTDWGTKDFYLEDPDGY